MPSLGALVGLVPLAIGVGKTDNEIEAPLAIAVLGGLATSTALSLVCCPRCRAGSRIPIVRAGYNRHGRTPSREAAASAGFSLAHCSRYRARVDSAPARIFHEHHGS
jgi:hypothetical protein